MPDDDYDFDCGHEGQGSWLGYLPFYDCNILHFPGIYAVAPDLSSRSPHRDLLAICTGWVRSPCQRDFIAVSEDLDHRAIKENPQFDVIGGRAGEFKLKPVFVHVRIGVLCSLCIVDYQFFLGTVDLDARDLPSVGTHADREAETIGSFGRETGDDFQRISTDLPEGSKFFLP